MVGATEKGASQVAQKVKNLPAMQETRFNPWAREDLLEKGMATHFSTLAWRILWTEEPVFWLQMAKYCFL